MAGITPPQSHLQTGHTAAIWPDKLREAHLRWFDHVLRAGGDKVCGISFDLGVSDKRSEGREKQRKLDKIDEDHTSVGIHRDRAHYRAKWRRRITNVDFAIKRENTKE
ncbi:hypothetical protein ANCDUO_06148 [Ancylostoma duodenale]|uniref:Uncharacterized protein n=1 Tax=Ancylostoma duodenale TaxID=51022 RepID=A0A0C2H299_9BILA|nr:hypothetical protein ANCDUO_06148 [Ancylostoma duodenale]